jgi:hypothetical protein
MIGPVKIDPTTNGVPFRVIAAVDTVDGDGNPVKAGTVTNEIVGVPDGKGGIVGWAPEPGYRVEQVAP